MKRVLTLAGVAAALLVLVCAGNVEAQKAKPQAAKVAKSDKVAKPPSPKAAAKAADKAEDRAERAAKKEFKEQPHVLLKGIKLTRAEKKQVEDIEKRYHEQFKTLEKQEDQAEKSGTPMSDVPQRIAALRDQERNDLRAVLTPAQQLQFDKNAVSGSGKH